LLKFKSNLAFQNRKYIFMNQVKTNLLKYLMMPLALICYAFQVQAQNVSLSGKVIDATTVNRQHKVD